MEFKKIPVIDGDPAEIILQGEEVIGNIRQCTDGMWHVTLDDDYDLLRLRDYPQGCGMTKKLAIEDAINSSIIEAREHITQMELLRLTIFGLEGNYLELEEG